MTAADIHFGWITNDIFTYIHFEITYNGKMSLSFCKTTGIVIVAIATITPRRIRIRKEENGRREIAQR